jgi:hypothetical protein
MRSENLDSIVGCRFVKSQFKNESNIVLLHFQNLFTKKYEILEIKNCFAFEYFNDLNGIVKSISVRKCGLLFEQYCLSHQLEYNDCNQVEIFFSNEFTETFEYKSFFIACNDIFLHTHCNEIKDNFFTK